MASEHREWRGLSISLRLFVNEIDAGLSRVWIEPERQKFERDGAKIDFPVVKRLGRVFIVERNIDLSSCGRRAIVRRES